MKIFYLVIVSFFTATFCNDLSRDLQLLDIELTTLSNLLPTAQGPVILTQEQKRASDQEVVKALNRLAGLEVDSWFSYPAVLNFVFEELEKTSYFSFEKQEALSLFLGDSKAKGSFLKFLTDQGIKVQPGVEIENVLPEYYEAKEITVSNERLQNISVEIFTAPSVKFFNIVEALKQYLAVLFYDMQKDETWKVMFAANQNFKEVRGFKEINEDDILTRILLNALVAQRAPVGGVTEDAKNISDAALYYVLKDREDMGDRLLAYNVLIKDIDWLRINPKFLKFDNMLCRVNNNTLNCFDFSLLTLLIDPKKIMGLKVDDDTALIETRLLKPLNHHYFGGDIKEDFGKQQAGESNFANIKSIIITQMRNRFF